MPVAHEIHAAALAEFRDAFDWYLERSVGAAARFTLEVNDAIAAIVTDPKRFPKTQKGCRANLLPRFPYLVIFHQEATRVVILAVAHAKRRPGYWRGRLS